MRILLYSFQILIGFYCLTGVNTGEFGKYSAFVIWTVTALEIVSICIEKVKGK